VVDVPDRWWFIGSAGSGKTTYARGIATFLDAPHIELDAVYHLPGWTPIDGEEMRQQVRKMVAVPRWTVDGNYRVTRPEVFARVQVIVAMDLPRSVIMRQLAARTWRRGWCREELWNGNRETLRNFLRWDPEKSILRFSWLNYDVKRERMAWLERVAPGYGITFLRVTTHDEARAELSSLIGTPIDAFLH
jgi:adenylate kinase family enzyme